MKRTHRCGEVSRREVGSVVCLQGWVWHRRDMGALIFIDLRDRAGFVQCVFDPTVAPECHAVAHEWRSEYVVEIEGQVVDRTPGNVNPDQINGDIEVRVTRTELLARAETPTFVIEEDSRSSEDQRLRQRFLDLRRPPLQRALRLRHKLALATRNLLDGAGFYEIETPMLTRSTPEGARDYLVPSRVQPGRFYALPQSPQLFKQLLMVSGYDRYFQIVRCFRDEDLRADRQPEFTQIDMEMSFVGIEDVREITEALVREHLAICGLPTDVEFGHMSFHEAIDRYGSDRPDLRFDYRLREVGHVFAGCGFRAFSEVAAEAGNAIKALRVPGAASWSRSRFDKLTERARQAGAKGMAWIKLVDGEFVSPIAKFLEPELLLKLASECDAEPGDGLLMVADEWEVAATALGVLRSELAATEGWIGDGYKFVWVSEFPLLERSDEEGRLVARHHPFTNPVPEDLELLETNPLAVRAQSYDLVLNGTELGGGSLRIHRADIQQRVFRAMGIDHGEASEKFGFLLRALEFGAPPHGGIALGFDRIVMMMAGLKSLRDVIAFPKTTSASDLMTEAPGKPGARQLEELHIAVRDEGIPADELG